MPFNSSGLFTRLYTFVADKAAGIKIRADRFDAELDGIATGLSTCITKDGQTTITADIPFSSKKITGLGDATAATDALNRQTGDARYKWVSVYDQTVAGAAVTAVDIALGNSEMFRIVVKVAPNTAVADFTVGLRGSTDNGATYAAGATDYRNLANAQVTTTVAGADTQTTYANVTDAVESSAPAPAPLSEILLYKGGASAVPRLLTRCFQFDPSGSYKQVVFASNCPNGPLTHIRILSTVANGLGIGTRIIVEGC